jgi:hypothetical protein
MLSIGTSAGETPIPGKQRGAHGDITTTYIGSNQTLKQV